MAQTSRQNIISIHYQHFLPFQARGHILHRVGDLCRQKTTEFSMALQLYVPKRSPRQNPRVQKIQRRPFLLLLPGRRLDPHLDFQLLILHAPHRNCYQPNAFLSGPIGKQNCQNNFPRAGGERKTINAAVSQGWKRKAGSATKWTRTPPSLHSIITEIQKENTAWVYQEGRRSSHRYFLSASKPLKWLGDVKIQTTRDEKEGEHHPQAPTLQFSSCFSVFFKTLCSIGTT